MNIGPGGRLSESGEAWVLDRAMKAKSADQPFVLFDVGANIGLYAEEALAIGNSNLQVYCFEPSATTYNHLRGRLKGEKNTTLFNFRLSQEESETTLHFHVGGVRPKPVCTGAISATGVLTKAKMFR